VAGKLQAELKQTRPFALIEEEALLNIIRTAEVVQHSTAGFLKEFDLSPVQYNVLRILRGAEPSGAACSQIGERLLTRDPDITRLLDRMESRRLIARERSNEDRRVVITRISKEGLTLLSSIDRPLEVLIGSRMAKFGRNALAGMIADLERVREAFEAVDRPVQDKSQKTNTERKSK
jgi:DNA-binding MarR family transcriptional regulator